MTILFDVILPVFLVVAFGYVVCWRGLLSEAAYDGVMRFAQTFAVPMVLFNAMAHLDIAQSYDPLLWLVFYAGAFTSFGIGATAAYLWLKRPIEDCVAIGFVCLFSNSLLLGVPIAERAYGQDVLQYSFTVLAIHSPLLYTFGITMMEFARARGHNLPIGRVALRALSGVLHTPLVIGILCGFAMNLMMQAGLKMPGGFWGAVQMIAGAGLPTALFALGGVLYRYRPEGELRAIVLCCLCSLILHPAIVFGLAHVMQLGTNQLRAAIITASMAPGVNAYLFASLYGKAQRVAASSVLVATACSVVSVWFWLSVLP